MSKATFRLDDEVLTDLREAVVSKHGKLYGALSSEAEVALKAHAKRLREQAGETCG